MVTAVVKVVVRVMVMVRVTATVSVSVSVRIMRNAYMDTLHGVDCLYMD